MESHSRGGARKIKYKRAKIKESRNREWKNL